MTTRIDRHGLKVEEALDRFISRDVLPGTGISTESFWRGFSELVHELAPVNRALLKKRDDLQGLIDQWCREHAGHTSHSAQEDFLRRIGYIVPDVPDFQIDTANVDPEIASTAGPQLVVPVTNARYALNAANARWGSLYDCFYGTDAIAGPVAKEGYDRGRGARVIARTRVFLDEAFPIDGTSHADARRYVVKDRALSIDDMPLSQPEKFVGYKGNPKAPDAVLLRNNGLHVELVFDRAHFIGSRDQALLADVIVESALTAIMDCEDSVACVDAADKIEAYANWLGLMKGDLKTELVKSGKSIERRLNDDRTYSGKDGAALTLKGRALMWIRNVGHLMLTPAIQDRDGRDIPEGLMDAMITVTIGLHDIQKANGIRNSVCGSIYVVKPKMHGPEEVAFTDRIFTKVESILGLPQNTVKIGIMDEERRTSVNLKACIYAARHRVAFINTGFLDRTGDEIHTSIEAGAFSRKDFIKRKGWITAYENLNVDIGLECGLAGKAQIGKGMWAMPDLMAAMLEQKGDHPKAGASCAWVPSPTAATLHALHYHKTNVAAVQAKLKSTGRRGHVDALIEIPTASYRKWSAQQIQSELDNNAQGILGYVVRWVDQGIGCSKVPDINDVGLMEDRATLRISAQHMANWLLHNVVTQQQVTDTLRRMAAVVDKQNAGDPDYTPMAENFEASIAFQTACELVFKGREQPNGYTEPLLHAARLRVKARK